MIPKPRPADILVDMDSIISNFCGHIVDLYNIENGTNLDISYITAWDTVMPNGKTMYDYFGKPGFFRTAPIIPGAQRVLKGLHDDGHNIFICSTATVTHAPGEKYEWLTEHYPWLHRNNVFFCKNKHMVVGDFLIDDHPQNCSDYTTYNMGACTIGIGYEYNLTKRKSFDFLAGSYKNFEAAWDEIDRIVRVNAKEL